MLEKIAEKLVNRQKDIGIIQDSDINIYKYGYVLAMETALNIIIGIAIGFVFHAIATVLLFWLLYIPLRTYGGGWHASKSWACSLISNVVLIAVILASDLVFRNYIWCYIAAELACIVVIVLFAPVDTKEKRLTENEKKSYKKIVVLIICAEEISGIWFPLIRNIIFCAYMILAMSLVVQLLFSQRKRA